MFRDYNPNGFHIKILYEIHTTQPHAYSLLTVTTVRGKCMFVSSSFNNNIKAFFISNINSMLTETYSVVQAVLLYLIISIFVLISMHKIVYIYIQFST